MARQSQTHVRQKAFLEAFAQSGNVVVASRVTGIPRSLVYQWIDKHQDFKAAFDKADKESAEHIEAEVYRRGVEGYLEPVFQKGSRVYEFSYDDDGKVLVDAKTNQPIMVPAYVRRYSDALLQLYLKGKLPEKYAERSKAEVETTGQGFQLVVKGEEFSVPGVGDNFQEGSAEGIEGAENM